MRERKSDLARRKQGKFTVLLTSEGTYPFHGGGVSTWCDMLMKSLPDIDFKLMAVVTNPVSRPLYDLPENAVEVIPTPLWGVEERMEYSTDLPFSQVYEAKRATTERVIETQFAPLFRAFTGEILRDADPTLVGTLLSSMHRYFMKYDYNTTFRSPHVWSTFRKAWIRAVEEERAPPAGSDARGQRGTSEGVRCCSVPSLGDSTECLRWLFRFLGILSHPVPKADLVHATAAAFCGIPCIIAKQAYGVPFLLTEHGVYLREQYLSVGRGSYTYHAKRFLMGLIRAIVRCCYRYADIVAPVCRWNARWEQQHGVPGERIQVIYNGVDANRFVPIPNIDRDPRPTVVTMALIYPLKDIATLIHSAHLTQQRIPDVQFRVFGPASDEAYYQSCLRLRERLHLESTFHFMGRTAHPEQAYNQGDVVALSSLSEAFPYSVVEAMMCGKPIVATDVGGVSEALEGTGITARAQDPAELAAGILTLLGDPRLRASMGADARQRALSRFSIDQFASEYRQTYERLIFSSHEASS